MFMIQLINVQYFCVLYFQRNNFRRDHHLSKGTLVAETGPKQENPDSFVVYWDQYWPLPLMTLRE